MKDPSRSDCKFDGDSLIINGDPNSVYVAILNLCKNGIDYGNQNVRVRATKQGDLAVISVVDAGKGIPEEQLPFIKQEGVSYNGSSGLGLAIASNAIERVHGGRLEFGRGIVSPYTGTEARLYLPLRQSASILLK